MSTLAIVIPLYKIDFFKFTLESLANQTCKDFTVYLGDDCSKDDFKTLVEQYKDRLDIHYTRFDENLGGKDLVAQWNRCIALVHDEPWIWLFSDDDVMDCQCVERFYDTVSDDYDVYHYNVKVIDETNSIVRSMNAFSEVITSEELYKGKSTNQLNSFVVEYIFRRELFERSGGFEWYDLAWNTDLATWIKLGQEKGIKTIHESCVMWRESGVNITPNHDNLMVYRKMLIDVDFIAWTNKFFHSSSIRKFNHYALFRLLTSYSNILTYKQIAEILNKAVSLNVVNTAYRFFVKLGYPFISLARKIKHLKD